MAKQIDKGYTNTPVDSPVTLTYTRDQINYDADFRIQKDTGAELWLTNITSPIDRPEKMRVARKEISNVYQGTDITSNFQAPSKKGVNLHVQLHQTMKVTDTENPEFEVHVPISTSITIKTPASFIDADHVNDSVKRLLSGLFETNDVSTSRLNALLRGSLAPRDL